MLAYSLGILSYDYLDMLTVTCLDIKMFKILKILEPNVLPNAFKLLISCVVVPLRLHNVVSKVSKLEFIIGKESPMHKVSDICVVKLQVLIKLDISH